jgi:hypothetical protein
MTRPPWVGERMIQRSLKDSRRQIWRENPAPYMSNNRQPQQTAATDKFGSPAKRKPSHHPTRTPSWTTASVSPAAPGCRKSVAMRKFASPEVPLLV